VAAQINMDPAPRDILQQLALQ